MALTQEERDILLAQYVLIRSNRLRGVRTVQYSDRSTTYASDAEMRSVEQDILRQLEGARPKQSIGVASKRF